jgi:hypothetical protein
MAFIGKFTDKLEISVNLPILSGMGSVYLLYCTGSEFVDSDGEWSARYKIGCTSGDVFFRRDRLQTGNPNRLNVVRFFETEHPFRLEKMLHNHFRSSGVLNEWFVLKDAEALDFINVCRHCEDIIQLVDGDMEVD